MPYRGNAPPEVDGTPKDEGVYIECVRHGALLKVSAIDPRTGTEASVFGPTVAREALTRLAVRKLAMVVRKAK